MPKDSLLINFDDGDVLDEANLDKMQKQILMAVQEAIDGRFAAFANDIDMGTFKIKNLGTPADNTDAANKNYVDNSTGNAPAHAAAAAASASSAAASAGVATTKAGEANTSATNAANSASNAASVLSSALNKWNNLSDLPNKPTARSNLGLGSAAVEAAGTGANQLLKLDSSGRIPAVNGSQIYSLYNPPDYMSPDTTIVPGGLHTFWHGLGDYPVRVVLAAVCYTAEAGFVQWDLLMLHSTANASFGQSITSTATHVNVRVCNGSIAAVPNPAPNVGTIGLTPSFWKLKVYAWK